MSASGRHASGVRRVIASLATATLSVAGLMAIAAPAGAAERSAITGITISSTQTRPVEVHSQVQVDATWAVDSSAQPGDTFTLNLPVDKSFAIPAAQDFPLATADGDSAGTCAASQQAIACTLNSYVATHTKVAGTLHFWMTAQARTASGQITFTADGKAIVVDVPGGKVVSDDLFALPNRPFKDGFARPAEGDIRWGIYATGGQLLSAGSSTVSITDTFDPQLSLIESKLGVYVVPDAVWTSGARWTGGTYMAKTRYRVTSNSDAASFTIEFENGAIERGNVYAVLYSLSLPANVTSGDVFTNRATGSGVSVSDSVTYALASGTAGGSSLRNIAVITEVEGGASAPNGPFEFTLSCTTGGAAGPGSPLTQTKTVNGGETVLFGGIPVGAACTIEETDSLGASVRYDATWPIAVTAQSPLTINVVATNSFALQAPAQGSTTGGMIATASASAPATAAAPSSGLATTGGTVVMAAGMAFLLIAGGAALVARRRRRTA